MVPHRLLARLAFATVTLALVTAACGGAQPTPTTAPKPTSPPATQTQPTPTQAQPTPTQAQQPSGTATPATAATATAAPKPTATTAPTQPPSGQAIRRGGVVGTVINSDPPSLDVTKTTTWSTAFGLSSAYNKLIRNKPTNFESIAIEPDLAQSWTVSQDGLTYTFKLQQGVKWQNLPPVNGRELTASDVAWTVNWILERPKNDLAALYLSTKSVEASDPYTVVFRLKNVDPEFLLNTAHGFNKVLAHEVFEKDGNFNTVVGTGAWIFEKWESGIAVTFKKNPTYFKKGVDGSPKPYLDGWKVSVIPDTTTADAAVRAGKVDFGPQCCGVSLLSLETMKKAMPDFTWQAGWRANQRAVFMNSSTKPLDDPRVRRAIGLAIDAADMIGVSSYAGYGRVESFVPRGVEKYSLPESEIAAFHKVDLAAAKQLLKEAGYEQGFRINIISPLAGSDAPNGMAVIKDDLAKINIDVRAQALETTAARTKFYAGEYDLAFYSGLTGFTPSFWLYDYQYSKGNKNQQHYNDPKYDAMVVPFMTELDETKRANMAHEMERYLWTTMPMKPLYMWPAYYAIHPRLKGYVEHWSAGVLSLEDSWVTA